MFSAQIQIIERAERVATDAGTFRNLIDIVRIQELGLHSFISKCSEKLAPLNNTTLQIVGKLFIEVKYNNCLYMIQRLVT